MKRYRTTHLDLDTRCNILTVEILDHWEENIKSQWRESKKQIQKVLKAEFGEFNYAEKEKNFIDLGSPFPSIIAFHNKFLRQARNSFIIGSYYPALTAITTLTERILNHLILILREDFQKTPEYKKIYKKQSFTDWNKAIEILQSWNILLPETIEPLQRLKELRHQYAAHFNKETDTKDRELALEAIRHFQEFIKIQFGFLGTQKWFIPGTAGAFFIKKEYETDPFVKKIYLPSCNLVGPEYKMEKIQNGFKILDQEYENREISDEEFVRLLKGKDS